MARIRQSLGTIALCLSAAVSAVSTVGCRVTDADVHRWETTELGPTKLVAVVTHDKYDWKLRVDAAVALVRMKPRSGRRIGIGKLQEAVATLPPEDRKKLVQGLAPVLIAEMDKPPVQQQGMPGEQKGGDPSIPYKDAAYALVNYDKAVLVADDAVRKQLTEGLIRWSTADFDKRIAISSQLYGIEQIFRYIGADAARALPPLIKPDSSYDKMSQLIAELGDAATKDAASQKLVALAQYTEGAKWFADAKVRVADANKAAGYSVADAKLEVQVKEYQEEQVTKVFASLKRVGGRPAVDYLLGVAGDKAKPEKRREVAFAALENRLDRNNPQDIAKVLAIAGAEDTPDTVRQGAFMRAAELPRDQVAPKLYELFAQKDTKKWKIRWVAGSTVLKMSQAKDIPEFLGKLPPGPAPGFTMAEAIEYGSLFGKMKPPATREDMAAQAKSPVITTALTALGWFYNYGKAGDVALIAPAEADNRALPKVEDAEAKWQCGVPKAGGKPGETEMKELAHVGDFVKLCVTPAMQARK